MTAVRVIFTKRLRSGSRLAAAIEEVGSVIRAHRGILALGVLLMIVNRASGLIMPASIKYLIDDLVGARRTDRLGVIIGVVVCATLVQAASGLAVRRYLGRAAEQFVTSLRQKMFSHMVRLPLGFYDEHHTGSLVSRVMSDVEGVRNLVGAALVDFIGNLVTAIIALIFLFRVSQLLTGVACVCIVLYCICFRHLVSRAREVFSEQARIHAEVTGSLVESISGIRVMKGYDAEERETTSFLAGAARLLNSGLKVVYITGWLDCWAGMLVGLTALIVIVVGVREILHGTLTVGGFVMFIVFLGVLTAPLLQLSGLGAQLSGALASIERTREVLDLTLESANTRRTLRVPRLRGQVVFDEVAFSYDDRGSILHDISLQAEPGSVTALVGPSGSGKSTIVGLVAAFYSGTAGVIWVDGRDLDTLDLQSYRKQLAVVLQETFLFDGTIKDNVSFARPSASDSEIVEACSIARIHEFVSTLPNGYNTTVGERGLRLSVGQRQRISIARAILADPRILILDEATSSQDSESEYLIQEGLKSLLQGRTTFVIAHRLSTIRRADQILVVEGGRIVEQGTHDSLCASESRYSALYARQIGGPPASPFSSSALQPLPPSPSH